MYWRSKKLVLFKVIKLLLKYNCLFWNMTRPIFVKEKGVWTVLYSYQNYISTYRILMDSKLNIKLSSYISHAIPECHVADISFYFADWEVIFDGWKAAKRSILAGCIHRFWLEYKVGWQCSPGNTKTALVVLTKCTVNYNMEMPLIHSCLQNVMAMLAVSLWLKLSENILMWLHN